MRAGNAVPDDDDEWITLESGDGWRMGLQTGHGTTCRPTGWTRMPTSSKNISTSRILDIGRNPAERARPNSAPPHPACRNEF